MLMLVIQGGGVKCCRGFLMSQNERRHSFTKVSGTKGFSIFIDGEQLPKDDFLLAHPCKWSSI